MKHQHWNDTAYLLWECGKNDTEISKEIFVDQSTVSKWRRNMGLKSNYGNAEAREKKQRRRMIDGQTIRTYRKFFGITQEEFGKQFNLPQETICSCEKGRLQAPARVVEYVLSEGEKYGLF